MKQNDAVIGSVLNDPSGNNYKEKKTMSLAQLGAYLGTEEAKKDVIKSAREAGFDVSEDDLDKVSGGDSENRPQ